MGPQLYGCGNKNTDQIWRKKTGSFNGAATLRLRKSSAIPLDTPATTWLQWGRNFTVAEIGNLGNNIAPPSTASMGPQLYGCGNSTILNIINHPIKASMGPQLYGCGNTYVTPIREFVTLASMGPQLYGCGNSAG